MTLRIAIVAMAVLATASLDLSAQGRRAARTDRDADRFGQSADDWCRDAGTDRRVSDGASAQG